MADAADPNVVWFLPERGFPIRLENGRSDDFQDFTAGMNLTQAKVTGLVSIGRCVWAATDCGAFQFNPVTERWTRPAQRP